jgi:hypothetical protein
MAKSTRTKTKIYNTCTSVITVYSMWGGRGLTFIKSQVYHITNNKNKNHTIKLHITGELLSQLVLDESRGHT